MYPVLRQATRRSCPTLVRAFHQSSPSKSSAKATLIGNLVEQPAAKQTRTGKEFVVYTVATNDPLGPPAEDGTPAERTTSYFSVTSFNPKINELLKTYEKGSLVHVEGTLSRKVLQTEAGERVERFYINQDRINRLRKPSSASAPESS